jgi:hypothetical protein
MCMNCKVADRCKCAGGALLPTCGCAAMIWCAECKHEPGANDRLGLDVLRDIFQAPYIADAPVSTSDGPSALGGTMR